MNTSQTTKNQNAATVTSREVVAARRVSTRAVGAAMTVVAVMAGAIVAVEAAGAEKGSSRSAVTPW